MREKTHGNLSAGMTCQELVELVTEYLGQTLAPSDLARFEAHLGTCAGCAGYIDQLRTTIAITGRLSEDSLSEESQRALLETFRHWKGGGNGHD
jgi:predicted anti-sigma-YlaC factor YlaD